VTVKARSERNFKRARVKPGRARRSRSRIRWRILRHLVALLVVGYAGYRALELVVRAAPLRVGRIIVPSTVEVQIVERQPIGISRLGSQLYLVDRSGTVIDEFGPRYREFDLPIVDGLVRSPRKGKPVIDATRAELAARVVDSIGARKTIAKRVSQIDVSNPKDVVVLLDGDPALLHLGNDRFVERLRSYLEVASTLRDRVADIDYVDLRFDDRVYVKPRGAAGTVEAGRPPSPRTTF
jgi:cell division septal protein FtsQ